MYASVGFEKVALDGMRRAIARRLTESKQQVPHIYLTVDIQLDKLLKLRGELNAGLSGRGVKLSVNDLLIKALGVALMQVPECNVQFAGDQMLQFKRADISVAVSIPGGLITPIVTGADIKGVVSFHGGLTVPESTDRIKARILICHGADDTFIPQETIEKLKAKFAGLDDMILQFGSTVAGRDLIASHQASRIIRDLGAGPGPTPPTPPTPPPAPNP